MSFISTPVCVCAASEPGSAGKRSSGGRLWLRAAGLILLLAGLFAAVACVPRAVEPMRLGTNVWPGYEPLYLARQLGYLDADGIRLVEYLSASEVIRAFRNRSIESAALTLDEALILQQDVPDLRIYLVTDISAGGDAIVARPGIDGVADLAGRRIGVESTAVGAYLLSRAAEQHGLDLNALRIVHLEVNEHAQAYAADEVDAVVTFDPVRGRLLDAGAVEIFSSRSVPGEIVDVLVIREGDLRQFSESAMMLAAAWFKAIDYLQDQPGEAARVASARLGMPPEQIQDSYRRLILADRVDNHRLLGGRSPALMAVVQRMQALMLGSDLLHTRMDLGGLLTPGALRADGL